MEIAEGMKASGLKHAAGMQTLRCKCRSRVASRKRVIGRERIRGILCFRHRSQRWAGAIGVFTWSMRCTLQCCRSRGLRFERLSLRMVWLLGTQMRRKIFRTLNAQLRHYFLLLCRAWFACRQGLLQYWWRFRSNRCPFMDLLAEKIRLICQQHFCALDLAQVEN